MIINRERSSCFGRGFSVSDSFLANFKEWIVRTPVASPVAKSTGGPGWYIVWDQSAIAVSPFIVVSNHSIAQLNADPNNFTDPHLILKVVHRSDIGGQVDVLAYSWFNETTKVFYGPNGWYATHIDTLDAAPFIYDFRGGPDFITIGANNNTSWSFFALCPWFADATHAWWPFDKDKASAIVNPVTVGTSNKWLDFSSQEEAKKFLLNQNYFLYNFNNANICEWHTVVEVDYPGWRVRLNEVSYNSFAAGSVLAAYGHRYYAWSTNPLAQSQYIIRMSIPYCTYPNYSIYSSDKNKTFPNAPELIGTDFIPSDSFFIQDDFGNIVVESPFFRELYNGAGGHSTTYMQMVFGRCLKSYMSRTTGLTQMQTGLIINSKSYIYMASLNQQALLFPDFDSIV